jgi:hypothetical protein
MATINTENVYRAVKTASANQRRMTADAIAWELEAVDSPANLRAIARTARADSRIKVSHGHNMVATYTA